MYVNRFRHFGCIMCAYVHDCVEGLCFNFESSQNQNCVMFLYGSNLEGSVLKAAVSPERDYLISKKSD